MTLHQVLVTKNAVAYDAVPVMSKPIFVPRHKRNTIISQDQKEGEEKCKMESRMLVAEVVAALSAFPKRVGHQKFYA